MGVVLPLNVSVSVYLTAPGKKVLDEWILSLARDAHQINYGVARSYRALHRGPHGSYLFSLWELMQVFGPWICAGGPAMFVSDCITVDTAA